MERGQYLSLDGQIARFCRWGVSNPFQKFFHSQGSLPHLSTTAKDYSATARSGASRNGSESTFRKGPSERQI
jgi:hypothetical protein